MKSEKQKMLAGEPYYASDPELTTARTVARELCQALNQSPPHAESERRRILNTLFKTETDVTIEPPFFCDYGWNIHLGKKVYFNFNCVVLDVMPVTIGDHTLIGPAVQIYAAAHPLEASVRRSGLESGKPVSIGSDVWIGGSAIICPGVTIGDRTVIGAGSVVTADLPADVLALGNPARVIRELGEAAKP